MAGRTSGWLTLLFLWTQASKKPLHYRMPRSGLYLSRFPGKRDFESCFDLPLPRGAYYSVFTVGCAGIVYSCYNLISVYFPHLHSSFELTGYHTGQARDRVDIFIHSIELNPFFSPRGPTSTGSAVSYPRISTNYDSPHPGTRYTGITPSSLPRAGVPGILCGFW